MDAEFRAVGVPKSQRGAITDATLAFLNQCFANDEVELNGQRFLFLPRPARPPIFVGGAPPHALRRTVRYGDGWMPMGGDPKQLAPAIRKLHAAADAAGKATPEVAVITTLPLDDPGHVADQVRALADIGVTRIIHGWRYADAAAFARAADALANSANLIH